MQKTLIIGGVILVVVLLVWFFVFNRSSEEPDSRNDEAHQVQDFPERFDEEQESTQLTSYENEIGGFGLDYPENWSVTEGDMSEDSQHITIESPMDINEFYFCLSILAVDTVEDDAFYITETLVRSSIELENGRHAVTYGAATPFLAISDQQPQVEGTELSSQISGQTGRLMQVFGQFNCRDGERPELTTEEFNNARWVNEAQDILESIEF